MTSPDQKVNAGTDVHLSCNFSQCSGPLDVMSLSVEWEFKVGLYFFRNTDTHIYLTLFIQACIIIKLMLLFVFFKHRISPLSQK